MIIEFSCILCIIIQISLFHKSVLYGFFYEPEGSLNIRGCPLMWTPSFEVLVAVVNLSQLPTP